MTDADHAANDVTSHLDLGDLRAADASSATAATPRARESAENSAGVYFGGSRSDSAVDEDAPAPTDPAHPDPGPGPDAADDDGEEIDPGGHRRRRSAWKTLAIVVVTLVLVCSGTTVAVFFGLMSRYDDKVARQDILGDVPKPVSAPTSPMNFLVLGSDSRADGAAPIDSPDGSRSDTIMIVHVNANHDGAFIFSIPRDSYVNVPAGGSWKGGPNKINAAFAFGGAKLAAKTVYELTKIPLDGAMIVNFAGIHSMVAEVGTVNVCVPYTVTSLHTDRVWAEGCHDMGPDEAEDFMRQRKSVPGGDFGRIHDQQLVVRALANKISSSGMLTNPMKLDSLIVTAATSVTVDRSMNLRDLVLALRNIKPANMDFATAPYKGTMTTAAGSSVELDMAKAQLLFQAVIADKTTDWLATNPQNVPK